MQMVLAYHAIRRDSIFAIFRFGQAYDDNHADERKPENHPHVFTQNGEVIGTIRIDLLGEASVAFRLIGIRKDLQRQGLGTILLQMAEETAFGLGAREIVINSTMPSLSFYLANGYTRGEWYDVETLQPDLVRVGKRLILKPEPYGLHK